MALRRNVYQIVWDDEMWLVRSPDGLVVDRTFTKEQAVEFGRRRARSGNGRLIIHREDGTIESDVAFGQDPPQQVG